MVFRCWQSPYWNDLQWHAISETTAAGSGSCCSMISPQSSAGWTFEDGGEKPAHPWTQHTANGQSQLQERDRNTWEAQLETVTQLQWEAYIVGTKVKMHTYCISIQSGRASKNSRGENWNFSSSQKRQRRDINSGHTQRLPSDARHSQCSITAEHSSPVNCDNHTLWARFTNRLLEAGHLSFVHTTTHQVT